VLKGSLKELGLANDRIGLYTKIKSLIGSGTSIGLEKYTKIDGFFCKSKQTGQIVIHDNSSIAAAITHRLASLRVITGYFY
jgi:hypothetical protein